MYDFQRQHPIAAVSRAVTMIRANLITILIFLFIGARSESFSFLFMIGGGFALLMVSGVLDWWRFLFKVEEGEMHIKRGIFVRQDIYLTKDRVQVIDISSGVIQRMFGLVKIDIQTAGATSRAAMIEAVPLDTATIIKQKLSKNGGDEDNESDEVSSQMQSHVYGLPNKDLLVAASTSGRFGIALSVLGTLFSQVEPAIRESNMFEYIFSLLPAQTDTFLIASIIIVFIIIAWLISFFSTLFMYGDFSLEIKKDELIISRGIFEKKRITVPYKRIQALYVTEGILRQPMGFCSVHIHSAGYGDEQGSGSIVLFPLIRRDKVEALLEKVVPHYNIKLEGIKPPARAIRRYIFRSAALLTLITGILYLLLPLLAWIWLLPLLSVLWGWLKYRDAAIGWDEHNVIISDRTLSKTIAIVKKDRIQDLSVSASWIQRFRNLSNAEIHVASGDHGSSFSVIDIEESDAESYLNAFNSKMLVERNVPAAYGKKRDSVMLPDW